MPPDRVYSDLFDDSDFEECESSAGNGSLQRGNSDFTTYRRTSTGTGTLSVGEEEFASPENLQNSLIYLRSSLQGPYKLCKDKPSALIQEIIDQFCAVHGFRPEFDPSSGKPEDAARCCNLIYDMLMQRQRDVENGRSSQEMLSRMGLSLTIAEQARTRLEQRLQAQERQIGSLENKVQTLQIVGKSDTAKMNAEAGDLQKANFDLKRRQTQFQHELKRKELEIERLQAKLHEALAFKRRSSEGNQEAATKFTNTVQKAAQSWREEDVYKKMAAENEARSEVLLNENRSLRSALDELLQGQNLAASNQAQRASQLASKRRLADRNLSKEVADLTPAGLVTKLQTKLEQLEATSSALCESIPASPLKEFRGQDDPAFELRRIVGLLRNVLTEYTVLSRLVVEKLEAGLNSKGRHTGLKGNETIENGKQGLEFSIDHLKAEQKRLLEEKYRGKVEDLRAQVLELESKLATACLQAQGNGKETSNDDIEKKRLALIETEAKLTALLETKAKEMGQEKWEFETQKKAYDEAMRQFAPGFGAGKFLAKAMARQAAKTAAENYDTQKAEQAGRDAIQNLNMKMIQSRS